MRPMVVQTGARLLSTRHPRSVTLIKAIKTCYNGVTHLPSKQVKLMNQLGDCFSKKVSLDVLDSACEGHDFEIKRIKRDVESLYLGEMAGATPRRRRAMATRLDIRGGSHFGDNLGIVSTSIF